MRIKRATFLGILCGLGLMLGSLQPALAQPAEDNFSLQVSPSPIVETIKPGTTTTLELKIQNTGINTETLKIGLRAFTINSDTGEVTLTNDPPKEVADWISFSAPIFTVETGQWYTQKVTINTPESAGFSYSFAMYIERNEAVKPDSGETALHGSVAVFTLLTIDKPGATRQLEIENFSTAKKMYQYLPAEFSVKFKNTGNVILQPGGTIFIQRPGSDKPIATLPVNPNAAYLLPDNVRTLQTSWNDGFPLYVSEKTADNADAQQKLQWDFSKANTFRFGKYEAKIVAVYNDGQRDIPVTATVSFMVVPWKLLGIVAVIAIILLIGIVTIVRKFYILTKRSKHGKHYSEHS